MSHYPFGNWYLMPEYVDTKDPANYVMADMAFHKNFASHRKRWKDSLWGKASVVVTKTSTIRFPQEGEHSWDPFAIIPSFAHALSFAYNWSVLVTQPECSAAMESSALRGRLLTAHNLGSVLPHEIKETPLTVAGPNWKVNLPGYSILAVKRGSSKSPMLTSTCCGKPRAATGPTLEVFVWGQKIGRGSPCERF